MPVVLKIPAGRSVRRGKTNYVDSNPEHGYLELDILASDLLELRWIDKETGAMEEQLMLVPGDSTFTEVLEDDTGRTYVIKFEGCPKKFFFWLQRADIHAELRNVADLNGFMRVENYPKGLDQIAARLVREVQDKSRLGTAFVEADTAKLAVRWAQAGVINSLCPEQSLQFQLTHEDVAAELSNQPELIKPLKALLPHDFKMPTKPTPVNILPVIQAPQLIDAIQCLETALQESGLPAALMRELGLPVESGKNLTSFLRALRRLRPDYDDDEEEEEEEESGEEGDEGEEEQEGEEEGEEEVEEDGGTEEETEREGDGHGKGEEEDGDEEEEEPTTPSSDSEHCMDFEFE